MSATYATDAQVDATDTLARTALSAYSVAAVDRGASAVTDYDALRVEAQRQILIDLAARGILQAEITDTSMLELVEVSLVLANLFESVGQWNGQTPDVYVMKGQKYRARYEQLVAKVNPRFGQRPMGSSFEWFRG